MDNPHPYDDDAYADASTSLSTGLPDMVAALWDAGADLDDIVQSIGSALENIDDPDLRAAVMAGVGA